MLVKHLKTLISEDILFLMIPFLSIHFSLYTHTHTHTHTFTQTDTHRQTHTHTHTHKSKSKVGDHSPG